MRATPGPWANSRGSPASSSGTWASRRLELFPHQRVRRAAERAAQPVERRDEDVRFPGFDFAHGAHVEVCQLGQLFLRELPGHAFAAQIAPKDLEAAGGVIGGRHRRSMRAKRI